MLTLECLNVTLIFQLKRSLSALSCVRIYTAQNYKSSQYRAEKIKSLEICKIPIENLAMGYSREFPVALPYCCHMLYSAAELLTFRKTSVQCSHQLL